MGGESIFVIVGICVMVAVLLMDKMRPGIALFLVAIVFMAAGIITADELAAGFSNKGVMTVAMLFLVSEGIRRSGALALFVDKVFPQNTKPRTASAVIARVLPSIAAISAFLNNTAVVVIFAPIIKRWAEKVGISPKKLLIPLSYATILGGMCTLIGTSTNLVVHGMMIESGYQGFSMFELGRIGIVITVVGIVYLIIFGERLLPKESTSQVDDHSETLSLGDKEYIYEVVIPESSPFIGQMVVSSRLADLSMFRVCGVRRGKKSLNPNRRDVAIEPEDTLLLAGRSDSVDIILSTKGMELASMRGALMREFAKRATTQVEVVIANRCPGVGKSIKEFNFFNHYHAVVLAIHRNGRIIISGVSSHILQDGDTLVLMTDGTFASTWGESSAFYLIAETGDLPAPPNGTKRWIGIALVAVMLLGAVLGGVLMPRRLEGDYDMFYFVSLVMAVMAIFGLFPAKRYTKFIGWDILIAIASAFAISKAMINAGVAEAIAAAIINVTESYGTIGALVMLYLFTMILTELITNSAAVALAFPVAVGISDILVVNPTPLFVAICVAASSSFASPIGYQTNLIVQGVGGYKALDFLRVGLPLNLIIMIISLLLIPLLWSF